MKPTTKEHIIRSTAAFVITICLITFYSDKQGSKTIIDHLIDSSGFKTVFKLLLWALVVYLAFGKLRSEKA